MVGYLLVLMIFLVNLSLLIFHYIYKSVVRINFFFFLNYLLGGVIAI